MAIAIIRQFRQYFSASPWEPTQQAFDGIQKFIHDDVVILPNHEPGKV